jgi:hypothetical protein
MARITIEERYPGEIEERRYEVMKAIVSRLGGRVREVAEAPAEPESHVHEEKDPFRLSRDITAAIEERAKVQIGKMMLDVQAFVAAHGGV